MIGVPEKSMVHIARRVSKAGIGDIGKAEVVRIGDNGLHETEDIRATDVDALE